MNDDITPGSSEEELQESLEAYFEDHGWCAIREVSPTTSRVRADLIVQHDKYGWIGIETKYFDGDGGAKVADAHHQIVSKYRGRTFISNQINLWAIAPFFTGSGDGSDEWHNERAKWRNTFTREIFCRHGIGYINLHRKPLLIDFAYSSPTRKIPVDTDEHTRHHENVKIDEIRSSVESKIEKYDY